MKNWILILLLVAVDLAFSKTIYFGPGQKYLDYESALNASDTGDNLIDCNDIDIKILPGEHWNWISFPRLERNEQNSANVRDFLPALQDWPISLDLLYNVIYFIQPTVEYESYFGEWTPYRYDVTSFRGYKLKLNELGDHILAIEGDSLPSDYKIPHPISARSAEWLGYWIPYPQNIKDAFGSNFDNVLAVEAEDWFYISSLDSPLVLGNNLINQQAVHSPSTSVSGKSFQYGKGYIIYFNEIVNNFQWNDSGKIAIIHQKTKSEKFTFHQKSSYEAIDFLNIPNQVSDIGVFVDSVCVGSAKIEDYDQQILIYPDFSCREEIPYEIRYINYDGEESSFNFASVYSKDTGSFIPKQIIAGKNKIAVINWDEDVQSFVSENSVHLAEIEIIPTPHVLPTKVKLILANYSEIVFSVEDVNETEIRQIIAGDLAAGEYEYEWNGTDNEGKNVSSGLYFYKVRLRPDSSGKTTDHEYSKRMLLLK